MSSSWSRTLRQRFDDWIFRAYRTEADDLAAYRIVFAVVVLAFVLPLYTWIPSVPRFLYYPPGGPWLMFPTLPSAWFFYALEFVLALALICLVVGYRTRVASLSLALALLVGYGWAYSFGKIEHHILLVIIPLVMAVSDWGTARSVDARRGARPSPLGSAWPVCLLMLLTASAMFYAGVAKILTGWLDPTTSAVRGHLTYTHVSRGQYRPVAEWVLSIDAPVLWELADVATVGLEVGFLVAVLSPAAMRLFCALAVPFHVAIYATFEIPPFIPNLLAYAVLVPWGVVIEPFAASRVGRPLARRGLQATLWHLLSAAIGVWVVLLVAGNPLERLLGLAFGGGATALHVVECALAVAVAASYLVTRTRGPGWRRGRALAEEP